MRRISLLLGLLLVTAVTAQAGHKPQQPIFLRIHVQTAGQGLPDTQARSIALPPNGETIQVRAMPEITERNLIAVQADPSGKVHLRFDHQGTVALDAFTGENQGKIMVVLLDDYVIYAPVIDEQITTGELVLPHPLDPRVIQVLQDTAKKNVIQAAKT